jgi:hypothetical protein
MLIAYFSGYAQKVIITTTREVSTSAGYWQWGESVALNETLILANRLLETLEGSGLAFESQLAASEIVTKLLLAAPYGSLALINPSLEGASEVSNHNRDTSHSEG